MHGDGVNIAGHHWGTWDAALYVSTMATPSLMFSTLTDYSPQGVQMDVFLISPCRYLGIFFVCTSSIFYLYCLSSAFRWRSTAQLKVNFIVTQADQMLQKPCEKILSWKLVSSDTCKGMWVIVNVSTWQMTSCGSQRTVKPGDLDWEHLAVFSLACPFSKGPMFKLSSGKYYGYPSQHTWPISDGTGGKHATCEERGRSAGIGYIIIFPRNWRCWSLKLQIVRTLPINLP